MFLVVIFGVGIMYAVTFTKGMSSIIRVSSTKRDNVFRITVSLVSNGVWRRRILVKCLFDSSSRMKRGSSLRMSGEEVINGMISRKSRRKNTDGFIFLVCFIFHHFKHLQILEK